MQLTIRMPDEFLPKLEEIAQKTGLKKSDITRMAIKNLLLNTMTKTINLCLNEQLHFWVWLKAGSVI